MLTNLKRVFNFALVDFYRNKSISLSAIFVLMVINLLFTSLFFVHGISDSLISTIKDKIDITAYFKENAPEQDILDVRNQILKASPDIKNVQYVSKEETLNEFMEKHKDSSVFLKALTEVGDNPFLPSLNITTTGNPSSYEEISKILQQDRFKDLIEKVDFLQKKDTIEKVFSITSNINTFGLIVGLMLAVVALLVVFNTIKLVIDRSREEISTMRIVGASNWFVKAPFIIEGAMFGFASFMMCFFITMILVYFLSPGFSSMIPGFSLFNYFISHFFIITLMQLGSGVALGAIFSFIAVKKYLSE